MTELLSGFLDPGVIAAFCLAIPTGLVFGLLPGLSGLTALAIVLPYVYGMPPLAGITFLLATHAVVYTGGSITAIVLGIPGSPPNAATVIDGYPLHRRGRTALAVGAALSASALGGLMGVLVLAMLLPVLPWVVDLIGSPETFLLCVMGIACVASLDRGSPVKGLIAGALGVSLALVGYQPISGVPRFWFGSDYLLDGVRLVPLVLGLFAIPELVALGAARVPAVQRSRRMEWRQMWLGARMTVRRRWLSIRSALIGVFIGIVPGVGGETAPFVAYAAARHGDPRRRHRYGRGTLSGVIAPESSNNAKEGGALVPTLAVGIPGSAGMAVLISGFQVLGLEPGPEFLTLHMDLAVALVVVLALANVVAALVMLGSAPWVIGWLKPDTPMLMPSLLILIMVGTYSVAQQWLDIVSLFAFGILGMVLKHLDYSRAAVLLGFVLGPMIETYLHISLKTYGSGFWLRPGSLVLIVITALVLAWPRGKARLGRYREGPR